MARSRFTASDYPAIALLAITFLNLTGVVITLTRPSESTQAEPANIIFFAIATPASLYLILRHARLSSISGLFRSFLIFFLVYLLGSSAHSLLGGTLNQFGLVVAAVYSFQIMFIAAIYFWAMRLDEENLVFCLRLSKYSLLASCLSVIVSPLLPTYQTATLERAAGFFLDQNLAAFGALFALVLLAACPPRTRIFALAEGGIAVTALLLTFSRTGFFSLLILCFFYLFDRPTIKASAAYLLALTFFVISLGLLIEYDLVHLSPDQRQRLSDVLGIFSAEMPQTRYEYRDILYEAGMERIKEQFPWGAGIGEFHSLEFGVRHRLSGQWLGVHNTYVMILGEAGLAALITFLFFWLKTIRGLLTSPKQSVLSVGVTIVILCGMLTTHSVLNDKVAAAMLAFLMVAVARSSTLPNPSTWRGVAPHNLP